MLEGKAFLFTALSLVAILIGGAAEILPTLAVKAAVPVTGAVQRPYTPLEVAGREVYVREGCYTCHSQMVRSMASDTLRYGKVSRAEEFIYDRPFQWGSKRTGPDLHREGGKYPNLWHYQHMIDARSTSPGSNMPAYAFLKDAKADHEKLPTLMSAMRTLGTPYSDQEISGAAQAARKEGEVIAADLASQGVRDRARHRAGGVDGLPAGAGQERGGGASPCRQRCTCVRSRCRTCARGARCSCGCAGPRSGCSRRSSRRCALRSGAGSSAHRTGQVRRRRMFQTIFQRLDDGTLVGPLLALFLFLFVFIFQLVRIVRAPRQEILAQAMLPLTDDTTPRRDKETQR
ncbi:MAG: cytochrome-c oxidase, cbb3-type subunit II [Myxococcales bacterium]